MCVPLTQRSICSHVNPTPTALKHTQATPGGSTQPWMPCPGPASTPYAGTPTGLSRTVPPCPPAGCPGINTQVPGRPREGRKLCQSDTAGDKPLLMHNKPSAESLSPHIPPAFPSSPGPSSRLALKRGGCQGVPQAQEPCACDGNSGGEVALSLLLLPAPHFVLSAQTSARLVPSLSPLSPLVS